MRLHKTFLLTALVGACVFGGAGPTRAHEGHPPLPSTGASVHGNQILLSPLAIKAIGMKTEKITLADVQHTLMVNARVELSPLKQAKVSTLASGKISRVLVKPGQSVMESQVLARVESLDLQTLQTELVQTAAEIELLQRLKAERQQLISSGGIAGKVLLETEAELQQNRAQREVLRGKLLALGLDERALSDLVEHGRTIDTIPVTSPIAGTLQQVDARPGQLVGSTDQLFEVVDFSALNVVGEVLETDAYLVKEGLAAEIQLVGSSATELSGSISYVRLKMDETERTLEVIVPVENPQGQWRPGTHGRMAIEIAAAEQEIVCPTSALIETSDGIFVLRREGEGKFSRHAVRIGLRTPKMAVVKSGLFPGQEVITIGTQLLAAMFDGVAKENEKGGSGQKKTSAPANAKKSSTSQAEKRGNLDRIVAAKATVRLPPSGIGFASSLIEGRVASILVKPGQKVELGDAVATLESPELRNLQLELLQTASRLQWVEGEVKRLTPLAKRGATSARELWQRELELKTLRQRDEGLRRRLELVGASADDMMGDMVDAARQDQSAGQLQIRAPLSGHVAEIGLVLGDIVHSHDNLLEIQNPTAMWVEAFIFENDAPRVQVGQAAAVTFPAHPNLRISGAVVRIAPQLMSRQRVLQIWIEIDNPDGFLRDGMLANVEIRAPKQAESPARQKVTAEGRHR